jgi:DnaJ-class molecular chaperone
MSSDVAQAQCHYAVLGLTVKADDDEIRRSYRALAFKHHPDRNHVRLTQDVPGLSYLQPLYRCSL